jgi:23S rRNA pseudouridine2605 synthase
MKKQFGRGKSGGSKPGFSKKNFSDKKSGGDKPFKKSFGGDKERGGDKPFKKSFGGDKERGGDKPFRKSFGGDKERGGDKPFRKSFGGDKERGGDKPFRKSFGGDKPFRKNSGDKPFAKNSGGDRERGSEKPDNGKRSSRGSYNKNFGNNKPFRKRGDDSGFTGRKFEDRSRKRVSDTKEDNWEVFDNKQEAQEFIKTSREEKKSGGGFSAKEYKNENQPFRLKKEKSDEQGIRLNRFISNTGLCSRREADELIEAGVVKVNGKIVTEMGTRVKPGDTVHYGDQLLRREKMVYVLLNKPKDYITTTDDPQERKTVMQLVEKATDVRIYPVGRLDRNTTGLLLFTNDGDLAERLTHPKNGIRKIYHVSLDKNLRPDDFEKILKGYEMEDGFMKADELSFVGDGMDKKEVGIVIHSGRNRIVRRLFETLGYDVIRLDRVVYAGLTKKNLPRGKYRHLSTEEVGLLRMQIGGEKKENFGKNDSKRTKGKRR